MYGATQVSCDFVDINIVLCDTTKMISAFLSTFKGLYLNIGVSLAVRVILTILRIDI